MKRTFIDKVIGFISPEAEFRRLRARAKSELVSRAYDAAQTFKTDDWTSAKKGSANSETSGAQSTLRDKGRDAIRNNPYAGRGLSAIVSNTIGTGIVPNIKAKSSAQVKKLNEAWKEWGETTLCDSNGKLNFYNMQALALRSTVESGESIVLKEVSPQGPTLRLLESDHIASDKDAKPDKSGTSIVQGVKVDKSGLVKSVFLYPAHPGDSVTTNAVEIEKAKVCHVYRQDRPGQLRGVSWFHPVIRQLEDFNQFQQATLISKKISACFSVIVTTNDQDSTLSNADLKTKRATDSMVEPGMFKYLNNGEDVKFAVPPTMTGYLEYCTQTLRGIASGLGITYEALTSDYSQVNFSSGRMGHIEFRRNCELWRWNMIIPELCDPAFQHFLLWCQLVKGLKTEGVTCEWVPPAWQMIDPAKEIEAISAAIRIGLTSQTKAIKEQGYDPDDLMQEIADSNKKLDAHGIILDSDPRKLTKAGLTQIDYSKPNTGNIPSGNQDN